MLTNWIIELPAIVGENGLSISPSPSRMESKLAKVPETGKLIPLLEFSD